jgi:ABC-type transport system involved in multi-copper enzyme maturation permease subunit
MLPINPKSIYTIAKKELLDNIRNKWILLLTIIFIISIVSFSYVAGGQTGGDSFGNMQITVILLMAISILIIPLIAIMLGFGTISGEAESGALYVVLSYPIKRIEVLLGKIIGLGAVISISIFLGFGLGGIIIGATVGTEYFGGYIGFIFLSIFVGIIYLSLSICISAYCKKRITSIAGGIVIFFWTIIYNIIISVILFATGLSQAAYTTSQYPDWYYYSAVFNPTNLYSTAVQRAFGATTIDTGGLSVEIPQVLSTPLVILSLIIWFIVPLGLAYFFFKRRDI